MSRLTKLNDMEHLMLNHWLDTHDIKLDYHTRNQFRDALAIARVFEKIHPEVVDLHSYIPRTSVAMMIENWKIFNIRVLTKLNICISQTDMERLALGTEGAIESLLYDLMVADYSLMMRFDSDKSFNHFDDVD
ncbi:GL14829 [Drosophila persimilis]|uniref:GL14829 n=1 Tax=Drosophila persimilis TaxID=7234 RepID=B4H0K4_DROPE|nr:sperm flagellar protein 1 [Drosophila persimilis]EDW29799.1 GL14829 [Drosophila persimilis]